LETTNRNKKGKIQKFAKFKLHKVDNSSVSIFSFDQKKFPNKSSIASNAFKRYKTLRHPSILPYIDGIELPDGINVVTESVVPLEDVIEDSRKHPQSLAWGINQIAVNFFLSLQF
jgi:SCY1-like protein 1